MVQAVSVSSIFVVWLQCFVMFYLDHQSSGQEKSQVQLPGPGIWYAFLNFNFFILFAYCNYMCCLIILDACFCHVLQVIPVNVVSRSYSWPILILLHLIRHIYHYYIHGPRGNDKPVGRGTTASPFRNIDIQVMSTFFLLLNPPLILRRQLLWIDEMNIELHVSKIQIHLFHS